MEDKKILKEQRWGVDIKEHECSEPRTTYLMAHKVTPSLTLSAHTYLEVGEYELDLGREDLGMSMDLGNQGVVINALQERGGRVVWGKSRHWKSSRTIKAKWPLGCLANGQKALIVACKSQPICKMHSSTSKQESKAATDLMDVDVHTMCECPHGLELEVLPVKRPPGQGVHLRIGDRLGPGRAKNNEAAEVAICDRGI